MVWFTGFLPGSTVIFAVLAFLLQLVALPSTHWAHFTARTDLGKVIEHGNYGLWSICSNKAPHWKEDCNPLDSLFRMPPYSIPAGIVAIIHLLLMLIFMPLGVFRLLQVIKNMPDLYIRPKILCVVKLTIGFVGAILSVLVVILSSIGENTFREYSIKKSWAFWIQTAVVIVDIILALMCAVENIWYWQHHVQERPHDPHGDHAETYGNPSFENSTPDSVRRKKSSESISYTHASGQPYPAGRDSKELAEWNNYYHKKTKKNGDSFLNGKSDHNEDTLTYTNMSFKENSPQQYRRQDYNW